MTQRTGDGSLGDGNCSPSCLGTRRPGKKASAPIVQFSAREDFYKFKSFLILFRALIWSSPKNSDTFTEPNLPGYF